MAIKVVLSGNGIAEKTLSLKAPEASEFEDLIAQEVKKDTSFFTFLTWLGFKNSRYTSVSLIDLLEQEVIYAIPPKISSEWAEETIQHFVWHNSVIVMVDG